MDTLICKGFEYDCFLGFHEHEQGVQQRISVDVEVRTGLEPAPTSHDNPTELIFDYFKANQLMAEFFRDKKFNLIETVGQGVAELLLKNFRIQSVKVSVTKKPLNMKNVEGVVYCCERHS